MLSAERSVQVSAAPREVLGVRPATCGPTWCFDTKIVKVLDNPPIDSDGNGFVVFRGSLRGLRGPKQRQSVKLDRWWSVTFTSDGPWLADRLMWMRGQFVAQPFSGGSLVTHSYRFRFKGPLRPAHRALRPRAGWTGTSTTSSNGSRPTSTVGLRGSRRLSFPTHGPPAPREQRRRARVKAWKDYRPPGWV